MRTVDTDSTSPKVMGAKAIGASPRRSSERLGERAFRLLTLGLAVVILVLVAALLVSMLYQAWPALQIFGPGFIFSTTWNPVTEQFGALPAIFGTVVTSVLGLLIAVPIGIGAAIFLVEFAPSWLARPLSMLIELLAAIPSVVIGLWALFVFVPLVEQLENGLSAGLGYLPIFSGPPLGIGVLAAGLVLAVMILPIVTAVIRDVLQAVPASQREAMLAVGGTRWETVVRAVLPYGQSGIVGAVILGLGRALGETMAVTMVIGNSYQISPSLFAPATTLASLIASQFREADSDVYLAALIAAGVVLFSIAVVVNVLARLLVWRITARPVQGGA